MKSIARFFGMGSDGQNQAAEDSHHKEIEVITEESGKETLENDERRNNVQFLNSESIIPNPFQPRKTFNHEALKELSDSIREFGIIQPLLVRKVEEHYELVAGERRLRASKIAGLAEVPVIIKNLNDKEMAEIAMIENLQREDLHFLEEAEGFQQLLVNFGFTQDVLAKRMGKSQSTVANKLRLLKLSEAVRRFLSDANLTERHARALLKLPDEGKQMEVLTIISEKSLNVKDSETLIQEILEGAPDETDKKKSKQNVVRVIRDVRIFLNTIQHVVGEMKKSGLNVQVKQEQDDEYITVKMVIPKYKK